MRVPTMVPGVTAAVMLCALSASSCGPMNARPTSSAAGTVNRSQCDPAADDPQADDRETTQVTKKHVLFARVENMSKDTSSGKPLFVGAFTLRGSDRGLAQLPKDAQITVTYTPKKKPDSTSTNPEKTYPLAVTRKDDGSFVGSIKMHHEGTCAFSVSIVQGGGEPDVHTFTLQTHVE